MIDGSYEALRSYAAKVETFELPGGVTRIVETVP